MKFRDEYWFLSSMYPCTVKCNGMTFRCLESAFQSCKDLSRQSEFINLDGYTAKKLGRKVTLRPDWEDVKFDIMRKLIRSKFTENPALAEKLKKVSGEIVEDNTWRDTIWGRCNGVGQNMLGKILMEVRDELLKGENI